MPSRRIVIVEEDADVRAALADVMRSAGAEVEVAADGADALERLRSGGRPACILLDLRTACPGGDFMCALRGDPRFDDIPVITMAGGPGRTDDEDVVARLRHIVDVDDLRRIVESLLDAAA